MDVPCILQRIVIISERVVHIQYNTNTNKKLYSALIRKNESEALVGQLGGKQVSFKFGFKGTVVSRDSDANRKTSKF